MKKPAQHVVPAGKEWGIIKEGSKKLTYKYLTQSAAWGRAKEIAKNQSTEAILHNTAGKIRERESYGNDPCPPKDKN